MTKKKAWAIKPDDLVVSASPGKLSISKRGLRPVIDKKGRAWLISSEGDTGEKAEILGEKMNIKVVIKVYAKPEPDQLARMLRRSQLEKLKAIP